MRKVGTAVVGCGNVAKIHAKALMELEESRLVAVCDVVEERARAFKETYGAEKWYTDFRRMVLDPEVEAVTICTPHPVHAAPAIAAAESGKHVLTEKPLAANLRQADSMIEVCRKAGVKLGVVLQRRLYDACQKIRKALDEGKIGTPIIGEARGRYTREREYYEGDAWRGKWGLEGGGVYLNQMVHEIDLLQWFMSSPVHSLYAFTANLTHPYIEVEDNAVTVLRFQSGALAFMSGSVSSNPPLDSRVEVTGSNGATLGVRGLDPLWIETWTVKGEEEQAEEWRREQQALKTHPDFAYYDRYAPYICHKLLIKDFLQAVIEDRAPVVPGEEGRKVLEIIIASYIASASGKTVFFPVKEDHPYHTAGP